MAPTMGFGRKTARLAAAIVLILAAAPSWAEFWEAPTALAEGRYPSFFATPAGPVAIWQESKQSGDTGTAKIRFARFDGDAWRKGDVSGSSYPFSASGTPPILYSASQSRKGTIAVAIAASGTSIEVWLSRPGSAGFALAGTVNAATTSVAPRIYPSASGGWLVFATQGRPAASGAGSAAAAGSGAAGPGSASPGLQQQGSVSIYVAKSADGSAWSEFQPLVAADESYDGNPLDLNLAPFSSAITVANTTTVAATTVAKDLVVFQTLIPLKDDVSAHYLLMSKTSADGGATWTRAKALTDFTDPSGGSDAGAQYYDNEAAQLVSAGGQLYVAWERHKTKSTQTQVWAGRLDESGLLDPKSTGLAAAASLVGSSSFKLSQLADVGGAPALVSLEDKLKANRVLLSSSKGGPWSSLDADLAGRSDSSGASLVTFARQVLAGGRTYVAWSSTRRHEPDLRHAACPQGAAPGARSRQFRRRQTESLRSRPGARGHSPRPRGNQGVRLPLEEDSRRAELDRAGGQARSRRAVEERRH